MLNPIQIILIPITIWSGLEQGFYSADFYQAYLTCAWGIENLGYVGICYGLCDAVASFSFGTIVQYIGRIPVVLLGALVNIAIITVMFIWKPDPEQLWIFFVIAGAWGIADAIWQTQINAFYGIVFPDAKEAAFSNYSLWESTGFIIAFVNADLLCVRTKMYILLGGLTTGIMGYLSVEVLQRQNQKDKNTL